jgi:replicative DNA helicase
MKQNTPEGVIAPKTSKAIQRAIVKALEGVTTPQEARRALENMDTAETAQEADFIITLFEGKGVDPTAPEIAYIIQQSKEWKAAEAKQDFIRKQEDALTSLIEKAPHLMEQLKKGVSRLNKDMMEEAAAINKATATLTSADAADAVEQCRATWEKDVADWNNDNDQDFMPKLFDELAFPNGTVSYIGARTGRGKTTTMINLAIEAMNGKRKTTFISLEESNKQVIRRFVLCFAYGMANERQRCELLDVKNPFTGKTDTKNAYKNLRRGREIGGSGAKTFVTLINKALKHIKTALDTHTLEIYDMRSEGLGAILGIVQETDKDSVVLFDYIQKIPAGIVSHSGNADLERIRDGSQALINAAKIAQCVIIAGAQLNRESQSGKADDTFTDADFRGCGDIEQDAHNAIGIGRNKEKTLTYYGLIKARESEISDEYHAIDFKGAYSYMERQVEEPFAPDAEAGYGKAKQHTGSEAAGTEEDDDDPWAGFPTYQGEY